MSDIMRKNIGNINDDIPTGYKKTALGIIPEDWQVVKLGEILKIGSGRDYKHLSSGDIPVYGTGGHMLYVNDYLYDGDSVGIGRKGTIDKPQFLQGKFWTVDTLFYTYDFKGVIPKYLYSVFLTINWQQYNEASGVPSLSKTTIETIQIFLPSSSLEQQKITEILSFWDDSINKLEELINHKQLFKKGMMQQIFSQKVRFKADDGSEYPAWAQDVPRNIGIEIIDGDRGIHYPSAIDFNYDLGDCLFLNAKNVTKNGFSFIDKMFITKEKDKLLKKGKLNRYDIILTTRGSLGNVAYYDMQIPFDDIRINSGMVIIRTNNIVIDSNYLFKYYSAYYVQNMILQVSFGSAQPQLTVKEIANIKICYPSLPEQQKIANFLTCTDNEILLLNQQLEQLKVQKRSLMQKLLTGKIRVC